VKTTEKTEDTKISSIDTIF